MNRSRYLSLVYVVAAIAATSACRPPQSALSPLEETSPVELPGVSPLLPPTSLPEGPLFTIDLPVEAGAMVLQGTGGPGVPLNVVNVTQMASTLGQGVVDPSGRYEIQLSQELVAGERVGLMLGELDGTDFQKTDFAYGPGYQDIPLIGVVFTSTLVVE